MNIKFPNKKYNIIYADPPWSYSSRHYQDGGREFNSLNKYYDTMSIQEIKNLPVCDISEKDCACFLWVPHSHLDKGVDVLKAWGFQYKTIAFNWVKKTSKGNNAVNYAPWTLNGSELCLLGVKGKIIKYKISSTIKEIIETEVIEAQRTIHSKKPCEARMKIEELFGEIPKIELFARQNYIGWDTWGNEVI